MVIEASCVGAGNYPVEIGCVLDNNEAYCALVRPGQGWTSWDTQLEKRHGVSREVLELYGKPTQQVAQLLNEFIREREIYLLNGDTALALLSLLYQHGGLEPTFTAASLEQAMSRYQADRWQSVRARVAKQLAAKRRRASNEARIAQMTWQQTRLRES